MKINILILMMLSLVIASCEKVTNVEVVEPTEAASFKYQLVDDAGKGVANVKVHAYSATKDEDYYYIDEGAYSDTVRTNAQGIAIFSDLKAGNYVLKTYLTPLNKLNYNTTDYVQVVDGVEKSKVSKISDFSAKVNIKLITQAMPQLALPGYGVALVSKDPPDGSYDTLRKLVDDAVVKGLTDSKGLISFTIPSDVTYNILLYRPDKSKVKFIYETSYTLVKGAINTGSIHAGENL